MHCHQRFGYGYDGPPSKRNEVAPLIIGPYTRYECPVIQPGSAVHHQRSSSRTSNTYLSVAYVPTIYPPCVCRMALGLPVEPDVYRMKSGSSASISSVGHLPLAMGSAHIS